MASYDISALQSGADVYNLKDILSRQALADVIDSGPKNCIEMTHAAGSSTIRHVTCEWDTNNKTMTLSGYHSSSDSGSIFELYSGNMSDQRVLPAGIYRLSGCPAGGSTSTYRATLTLSGATVIDTGAGADFTLTQPSYAAYRILVSGTTDFTNNLVFKPMVCLKTLYSISDKFVPFRPSYQELYDMVKALQT